MWPPVLLRRIRQAAVGGRSCGCIWISSTRGGSPGINVGSTILDLSTMRNTSNGSGTASPAAVHFPRDSGTQSHFGHIRWPDAHRAAVQPQMARRKRALNRCFFVSGLGHPAKGSRRSGIVPRCLPYGGGRVCGLRRCLCQMASFGRSQATFPWAGGNGSIAVPPACADDRNTSRYLATKREKHIPFPSSGLMKMKRRRSQGFRLTPC